MAQRVKGTSARPQLANTVLRLPKVPITDSKSRLHYNLGLRGFVIKDVEALGNCQFDAVADQLNYNKYSKNETKATLRQKVVAWLDEHKTLPTLPGQALKDLPEEPWDTYIENMRKDGTWGDQITLLALSALYQMTIVLMSDASEDFVVITTLPEAWNIQIIPERIIYLGYYSGVHYVSTRPTDDAKLNELTSTVRASMR